MRPLLSTIRGRLWAALAMLSLAALFIGALAWVALERVGERIEQLHLETTTEMTRAVEAARRAADLATAAPYLLNQRSEYLVRAEARAIHETLGQIRALSSEGAQGDLAPLLSDMATAVRDLEAASHALDGLRDDLRLRIADLRPLRGQALERIEARPDSADRLIWWTLYGMSEAAINAGLAGNLIGVGEAQRRYQRHLAEIGGLTDGAQADFLAELRATVSGAPSVFELRRRERAANTDAQGALFRVRLLTRGIDGRLSSLTAQAQQALDAERERASRMIASTRLTGAAVALASLALALWMSRYVSHAVTSQISRAAAAMTRLARGDRTARLPQDASATDEIGDLFRAFGTFRRNAIALERTNRLLDRRNALFANVFENISDGIAITDAAGRITARNPAFGRLLGASDAPAGSTMPDELSCGAFAGAAAALDLSAVSGAAAILESPDRGAVELRASDLPNGGRVWLVSDVTDRRRVEARLREIDRMETLGQLAGDTAHDFANVLSAIRTHLHLLDAHASPNAAAIESAIELGTSLTERLLAFARKTPLVPELVDLNELVAGVVDVLEVGLSEGVALNVVTAPAPVHVRVDPGQLEAVLVNLVLNANAACTGGGTVRLEVRADGTTAHLTVVDDGSGMEEAVRARAIEPFFTTRPEAGGTGLGLSIAYGFAVQSGGELTLRSEMGVGTSIDLRLPLIEERNVCASHGEVASDSEMHAVLVEDDAETRADLAAMLARLGYRVTTCGTVDDAIKTLRAHDWSTLVTDFDLAERRTGHDLAVLARSIRPQATVVLISGRQLEHRFENGCTAVLNKPVRPETLADALRKTTHGHAPSSNCT